ncbi:hypothetical protein KDN32_15860 [Nocardioides sp. J2M5]|uniref:hypothetical protein n=1 Tax=Nocardioides palaemonis TaxID=2829810 RepID=UPI001BA582EA|nr:hypothetical protein [Nocardioides palaemonis]MBS2939217.1 hypothetical protein [Nocardioides palaemonis]
MNRRTYGIGLLGALALLALVLPVMALISALGADRPAPPRSDVDRAYAISGELTCDTEVTQVPVLPLEAEPLAMLVCADPDSSMPWTAPTDLVEGDLSRLVDVLDGLEETPAEPYDCTFQGGPGYDLLLRFSRDRYARVHGDTGGCGKVSTSTGDYFGADEVLDAALALVEEQRERTPAHSALPRAPDCPVDGELGPAYSLTGDVTDIVVAVSCWRTGRGKDVPPWTGPAKIRPKDLGTLVHDIETGIGKPGTTFADLGCPGGRRTLYFQVLVGRTAWGDLIGMYGQCHEFFVPAPRLHPVDEAVAWHPSPTSQRILDGLRR